MHPRVPARQFTRPSRNRSPSGWNRLVARSRDTELAESRRRGRESCLHGAPVFGPPTRSGSSRQDTDRRHRIAGPTRNTNPAPDRQCGRSHPTSRAAHMSLFCSICGSISAWESRWVAAGGEWCDGDDGFGPWYPNSSWLSTRILLSALDLWCTGLTGHRTCAGVESLPASPPGWSVVPG
jgi:hypothetical protein